MIHKGRNSNLRQVTTPHSVNPFRLLEWLNSVGSNQFVFEGGFAWCLFCTHQDSRGRQDGKPVKWTGESFARSLFSFRAVPSDEKDFHEDGARDGGDTSQGIQDKVKSFEAALSALGPGKNAAKVHIQEAFRRAKEVS